LEKFLTGRPVRLEVASGKVQLEGVLLNLDDHSYQVNKIMRISKILSE